MAQYDVYPDPHGPGFLMDVQSDLLEGLNLRVVVPLMAENLAPKPGARLNPKLRVGETDYLMVTQYIAAIPAKELGTAITSLGQHHDRITAALDMLFHGF